MFIIILMAIASNQLYKSEFELTDSVKLFSEIVGFKSTTYLKSLNFILPTNYLQRPDSP
jgi:hypothetical protein